jgi:hypothetical protein
MKPMTFKQRLIMRKLWLEEKAARRKRAHQALVNVWNVFKRIGRGIITGLTILVMLFISVLTGQASEPIIYALNKPLGLGYAHFASYAETGLIMVALYIAFFQARSKK